ncbi:hypothetical protein E5843_06735 [Luteimonas yindakuii]|uniref:hypothetical protein n=1 Tax=Luteimonas yindakuii TaxID=2565782 RepID=UPI0011076B40|nr:hypothetical protein [Luteimonas yindakuii]QCO67543.2 hypothetical protein E5843_06735 [Luteimonas yindakuii]
MSMRMTPFPESLLAKARVSMLVTMTLLGSACHGSVLRAPEFRVVEVGGVETDPASSAPEYAGQCRSWTMDVESVSAFFVLSERISSRQYHHDFEAAPCRVRGVVRYGDEDWRFQVNGAAKGAWTNGSQTIYFGCTQDACSRVVMWQHVPMDAVD